MHYAKAAPQSKHLLCRCAGCSHTLEAWFVSACKVCVPGVLLTGLLIHTHVLDMRHLDGRFQIGFKRADHGLTEKLAVISEDGGNGATGEHLQVNSLAFPSDRLLPTPRARLTPSRCPPSGPGRKCSHKRSTAARQGLEPGCREHSIEIGIPGHLP